MPDSHDAMPDISGSQQATRQTRSHRSVPPYVRDSLRPNGPHSPPHFTVGTGWLPPIYDNRDFTDEHEKIAPLVQKLGFPRRGRGNLAAALPANVDLRAYCSPVEDQQSLGSCTANAAIGVVEY